MENGNEKLQQFNNKTLGADTDLKLESAESENVLRLREKFARELDLARERAEERLLEMRYKETYRAKLKRELSAVAMRKKALAEEEKKAAEKLRSEKAREELKSSLDEIEKRRNSGKEFLLSIKEKSAVDSSETGERKEEIRPTPPAVLNKSTGMPDKTKSECKVLITKKERFKIKKPAGIKLKFAPTVHHAHFPTAVPYPFLPVAKFPHYEKQRDTQIYAPSSFGTAVPTSFEDERVSFSQGERKRYTATENQASNANRAEKTGRGLAAGVAAFSGGAYLGRKFGNSAADFELDTELGFEEYGASETEVPEERYAPILEYDKFSDAEAGAAQFASYSDVEHTAHDYPTYSDVEHSSPSFASYSDVEHTSHDYPTYSDVEHSSPSFASYSDVEHTTHDYPMYSDVEHSSPSFASYSDVEHTSHDYPTYSDVEHSSPSFASYSDVEHTSHDYPTYSDVEHSSPSFASYSDVEHTAHDYPTYSDVEHSSPSFASYSDVEHTSHDYPTYSDVEHSSPSFASYSDVDHTSHDYPTYSDVEHSSPSFASYSDVEHTAHDYPTYSDVEHSSPSFASYSDVEHTSHDYPTYSDVEHSSPSFASYSDVEHTAHDYPTYSDVEHSSPSFASYSDVEHTSHDYPTYSDVDHASPYFDAYSDVSDSDFGTQTDRYGTFSENYGDQKALAAYEAMLMRKQRHEGRFVGYEDNTLQKDFSTPVYTDFEENATDVYDFSSYSERELSKYLKSSDRRVASYRKAILKKERSMKKLSSEDKTLALLDVVNLNKHVVDHRAMALSAVVAAKSGREKRYRKRLLSDSLNEYNSAVSDYEVRVGESYQKARLSTVADILGGKKYTPLPLISYSDEPELKLPMLEEELISETPKSATRREKNREKLRIAREANREERRIKGFAHLKSGAGLETAAKLSIFREKIERDIFMLKTRLDALRINAESRIDYLNYSFSASYKDKKKEIKELKARIRRLKRTKKRALKYERLDSERYYSQLLVTAENSGITKRAKLDKLDSLNMRLDALLSERERINEQLIKLYSGDIQGDGDKKINLKLKKIKKNVARRISRKFRREMRVLQQRVPLDIKQKLAKSVNKIIDAETLVAVLKYKLKRTRPRGEAKRDMKIKIRENRAAIKYYVSDYRRFLKRAKAYAERARGVKIQIVWILATLAVLVTLTVLYLQFEEPVNAFFRKIFDFLK